MTLTISQEIKVPGCACPASGKSGSEESAIIENPSSAMTGDPQIVHRRISLRIVNPAGALIQIVITSAAQFRMIAFRPRIRAEPAGSEIVNRVRAVGTDDAEGFTARRSAAGAGAGHPHGAVLMGGQWKHEKYDEAGQE